VFLKFLKRFKNVWRGKTAAAKGIRFCRSFFCIEIIYKYIRVHKIERNGTFLILTVKI